MVYDHISEEFQVFRDVLSGTVVLATTSTDLSVSMVPVDLTNQYSAMGRVSPRFPVFLQKVLESHGVFRDKLAQAI